MRTRLLMIVAALALLAAACGDDDDSGSSDTTTADTAAETTAAPATTGGGDATTTAAAPTTEGAEGTTTAAPDAGSAAALGVATGDPGEFVVDSAGNSLYIFIPDDASGTSSCYDICEDNWPPIGEASAGEGVDEALIGTTTRDDGSVQVTYNGWPLYQFSGDSTAGDVNGQGIEDVWFVIAPDGTPIGAPA